MPIPTYPSAILAHRRADIGVHALGLALTLAAGAALLWRGLGVLDGALIAAVIVYFTAALASNLASWAYHFAPWHDRRALLRRIDHAAIYPSITASFTPFFLKADTTWTLTLLGVCWCFTALAIWNKITNENVKSRWSTASYLALGAIGLLALPDLSHLPVAVPFCIIGGAVSYVIGTFFYARKTLPYRYAIWHVWVNFGAVFMYAGIWIALFW